MSVVGSDPLVVTDVNMSVLLRGIERKPVGWIAQFIYTPPAIGVVASKAYDLGKVLHTWGIDYYKFPISWGTLDWIPRHAFSFRM
jgi:hypothetical protein